MYVFPPPHTTFFPIFICYSLCLLLLLNLFLHFCILCDSNLLLFLSDWLVIYNYFLIYSYVKLCLSFLSFFSLQTYPSRVAVLPSMRPLIGEPLCQLTAAPVPTAGTKWILTKVTRKLGPPSTTVVTPAIPQHKNAPWAQLAQTQTTVLSQPPVVVEIWVWPQVRQASRPTTPLLKPTITWWQDLGQPTRVVVEVGAQMGNKMVWMVAE